MSWPNPGCILHDTSVLGECIKAPKLRLFKRHACFMCATASLIFTVCLSLLNSSSLSHVVCTLSLELLVKAQELTLFSHSPVTTVYLPDLPLSVLFYKTFSTFVPLFLLKIPSPTWTQKKKKLRSFSSNQIWRHYHERLRSQLIFLLTVLPRWSSWT